MKITITGDFCPIHRAENLAEKKIFTGLEEFFSQADYNITNLECPLTRHDQPITKTGPALRASPEEVIFLKKYNFNLVTLANNHIMDFGSQGLKDTLQELDEKDIAHVGAGRSKDSIDVVYLVQDEITVAIVNLCENEWSTRERDDYKANGFSEIEAFYSVRKAKENADQVIVIHHGGHEMYNLPSPRLKKTLRFFVDCGADLVINHHTHCISGKETYQGKQIFYSLGNFIFDLPSSKNTIWNYGMLIILEIQKEKIDFEVRYFRQFAESPSLDLINEKDIPYDLQEVNRIIHDDALLEKSFESFVNEKKKMYNNYLEPIKSRYYNALKNRGIFPSLWNKKKRFYLKNLISCESHREIILKILEGETGDDQRLKI